MAENLTTYTEVDPNNRLTITSPQVTFTGLDGDDGDTTLSKLKGVDVITVSVGLTFISKTTAAEAAQNSSSSYAIYSDRVDTLRGLLDTGDTFFALYGSWNGSDLRILTIYEEGGNTLGFDIAAGAGLNTDRLYDVSRAGDIYTIDIYNGDTVGSGIWDTLTFDATTTPPNFDYLITVTNDTNGTGTQTGYCKDYIFTGLTVAAAFNRSRIVNMGATGPQNRSTIANA